MIMPLPFLLGFIAILLAMSGRRGAAIGIWAILALILVAWFKYHATDSLGISF
jgi:hypothetical protein